MAGAIMENCLFGPMNNTVATTDADGIYTSANGGPQLKNNIVQVSGPGLYCISEQTSRDFKLRLQRPLPVERRADWQDL